MDSLVLVTNDQKCWKTESCELDGLTPLWGSVPRAFQKCITYGGGDDLTLSYGPPKSTQISIFFEAEMRCSKKSHGHNRQNWGSISNQRGTKWVSWTLIQYGGSILEIVAVTFFLTAHNFGDAFTFSAICWLWAAITWPKIIRTPICHTYSESCRSALSHGASLS